VSCERRLTIAMAGPLPPPLGGTTVLFDSLRMAMSSRRDLDVRVVGTGGVRGRGAATPLALLSLRREIAASLAGADVAALHVSTSALHLMGPLFARECAAVGVPFIVRKFGGTDFMDYGPVRRRMILGALSRADAYLAETRALVRVARMQGIERAMWFPNSRPMPPLAADTGPQSCRRFVFLGQVHRAKGVRELIAAGERMPDGVEVDFYGTLGHDVAASEFEGLSRVSYKGSVAPGEVHDVLSRCDALVLPSYHSGEGYPGVVLEAFGAGLPVIVTRWRALPELVDDSCGLLVEPRDPSDLESAMRALVSNAELYTRLRAGVRSRRTEFSDPLWHEAFVAICRETAERAAG
jgi:glycosyltransferase involved in cell wall biosynthesis